MTDLAKIQRQIAQLQSDTAAQSTVVGSAVTLISGLSAQLKDVQAQLAAQGVDTSPLDAVITQMEANNATLSTAVASNTAAAAETAPATPAAAPADAGTQQSA